jgi:hypothetical protein
VKETSFTRHSLRAESFASLQLALAPFTEIDESGRQEWRIIVFAREGVEHSIE